jgi:hypothetical protein
MKLYFSASRSYNTPENPQILALSGAHLRDGLNLISQWLILRLAVDIFDKEWKKIFQPADPTILPETPQINES